MRKMLRAKSLLYERNILQADLARVMEISETRLSRILNGRDRPRETELARLAAELGVPAEELLNDQRNA
jgi:transcriptional regulator with XRE-family HTH domain